MAKSQTRKADYSRTLGTSGLSQSNGRITEEWNRQLVGDKARKVWQEMSEQDPSCGAVLGLVRAYTLGTKTYLEPASEDAAAVEVADFVDECRHDMSHTWSQHIAESLSCLSYGWAWFETIYKQREQDGRIGWAEFSIRGQSTLDKWEFDENGKILGMHQHLENGGTVLLPAEKAVHYRVNVHKNNPEGRSMLRAAYRPYYFLKRLQEIEAIGAENDATGIPYLQVPPALLDSTSDKYSATLITDLEEKVTQIGKGTRRGLVIGAEETGELGKTGWKLDLLRSGGRPMYDVNAIILRYRAEIVNAILNAGFIYLGQEQHGSFSLADSKTNTFAQALSGLLDDLCDTFTRQAIKPLCELNGFAPELAPKLVHGDVETPSLAELGDYLQKLVGIGLISRTPKLEERVREIARLPVEPLDQAEDFVKPDPTTTETDVDEMPK